MNRRASRRGRANPILLTLLAMAAVAGCARTPTAPSETPAASEPASGTVAAAAVAALPPGPGRALLESRCTPCHDLGGLEAYKGYYNETRWRGLVETMIAHGAELNETEIDELVAYLVEHFGPGTR